MSDELTLKVGRKGAELLLRKLVRAALSSYGDDRRYLESICYRLKDFIDRPPPKYVELKCTVVAVGGKPVEDNSGSQKNYEANHKEGPKEEGQSKEARR